jgi:hypothetical protein
MRDAFRTIDPSIADGNFLALFQASGCYLIDLCPEPVDPLNSKSRRAACRASEVSLARTIARLHPLMIATVVRSIEATLRKQLSAQIGTVHSSIYRIREDGPVTGMCLWKHWWRKSAH